MEDGLLRFNPFNDHIKLFAWDMINDYTELVIDW